MEISERLRQVIESKGITWDELSVNSGIAESTISRILNNSTNNPQKSTTQALAEYLQINEEWLRTGKGDMLLPTSTAEPQTHLNNMDNFTQLLQAIIRHGEEISEHRRLLDRAMSIVEQQQAERTPATSGVLATAVRDSQNPPPLTKRKQIITEYLRFNPILTKKTT